MIKQLADSFIQEAISSPVLMNDLATMEMYIAESYTGRSLIELLQNADDAEATRFLVQAIDESTFIAANNGRVFSNDDLRSLCRSGASTKQRKSNTIGFRGIGFKSVVNYAENVHVLSGEYRFTFSRTKTAKFLPNDIKAPLIRIPHEYSETKYDKYIEQFSNQGFNTIFIFEANNNKLEQELAEFSQNCLLFLNHVSEITFNFNNKVQIIESHKRENQYGTICSITKQNDKSEWLVIKGENKSAIALKWANERIIPCSRDEAVVHSFLPTQEYLSIPMKINGDFSTDPSRTRISCDDETNSAIIFCSNIVSSLYKDIIFTGEDDIGIVSILSFLDIDPISKLRGVRVNDLINEKFLNSLRKSTDFILDKREKRYIAIQPKWLSDDDIDLIQENDDVLIIGNDVEKSISGIKQLLTRMKIVELDINTGLKFANQIVFSLKTRINLINAISNDGVYGLDKSRISLAQNAKLFDSDVGVFSIKTSLPSTILTDRFVEKILGDTEDSTKISYTLKKIGFNDKQLASIIPKQKPLFLEEISNSLSQENKVFKKKVIKKWRRVEQNVAALLETLKNTVKVEDVSEQNLGYDIKVLNKNGKESYYEVKSVNSLGDSISITNNEYSTANEYGERYYLAIVQQDDDEISVCFVRNPVKNLDLQKRVVRWEWVANSYKGEVVEGELE